MSHERRRSPFNALPSLANVEKGVNSKLHHCNRVLFTVHELRGPCVRASIQPIHPLPGPIT